MRSFFFLSMAAFSLALGGILFNGMTEYSQLAKLVMDVENCTFACSSQAVSAFWSLAVCSAMSLGLAILFILMLVSDQMPNEVIVLSCE